MLAEIAMQLWKRYGILPKDIALLSPYRKQVKKLEQILYNLVTSDPDFELQIDARGRPIMPFKVSTVEMFQGRESPVVLLSCVRNGREDTVEGDINFGIGFLKQPQRANVAMSRARDLMIIAGNARLLYGDDLWRSYLDRLIQMPRVCMDFSRPGAAAQPMQDFPAEWRAQPQRAGTHPVDNVDNVTAAHEERSFERHI